MNVHLYAPGNGAECPAPQQILTWLSELGLNELEHYGTFSAAIYDTAWMCMIYEKDDSNAFAFPQSFQYLLETQDSDGTWTSMQARADSIINTLAALLAMVKRKVHISSDSDEGKMLEQRIKRAKEGTITLLKSCNLEEVDYVGFEVLVLSLLRQLDELGIRIEFSGRAGLTRLCDEKLQKFSPQIVYSGQQTTLLHSLEALTGMIDFDKVKHHCSAEVGIMGSPSATASYLINASEWDPRAYSYLQTVVEASGNSGAVPSAFPTSIFEISWATSSLLAPNIPLGHFDRSSISELGTFLENLAVQQDWLVGFAPKVLEDADDTARTLMTLRRLNRIANGAPMVARFETSHHFQTYPMERNPSFSANCNVLLALLELEAADEYYPQIEKILAFIFSKWDTGHVSDKWNLCSHYTQMLIAEALVGVLTSYNSGKLQSLPLGYIQDAIPLTILQILLKALWSQEGNGSWASSLEATSWAVLCINYCLCLPWDTSIFERLNLALSQGRHFLQSRYPNDTNHRYFWVEKTTYQSPLLKVAYSSAAIHAERAQYTWQQSIATPFQSPEPGNKRMKMLFQTLPIFAKSLSFPTDLVFMEARCFLSHLIGTRSSILQRSGLPMTEDKYLEFIPMIWSVCNDINGHALASSIVRDMIVLSLYNYQIDEFVESVVSTLSNAEVQMLEADVRNKSGLGMASSVWEHAKHSSGSLNRSRKHKITDDENESCTGDGLQSAPADFQTAKDVIRRFVEYVLHHNSVVKSPEWLQRELAIELYHYLTAQFRHNQDNTSWQQAQQTSKCGYISSDIARGTYSRWLHSTGEDDTSCPFAFLFFMCLIGKPGQEACFDGPQARYVSQSLARHLAAMCRMHNDYGSAARDAEEGNLNSLDFDEFHATLLDSRVEALPAADDVAAGASLKRSTMRTSASSKDDLMAIAEFERAAMELSLEHLSQIVASHASLQSLKVFIDVTDTFGQIYVQKDIASRRTSEKV